MVGGLFNYLDQQLIVAAQSGYLKIDNAVLNKPLGVEGLLVPSGIP